MSQILIFAGQEEANTEVFLKNPTRKIQREYNAKMFSDAKSNEAGKVQISLSDMDAAGDILVASMLEKIGKVIDQKTKAEIRPEITEISMDVIDDMDPGDFKIILDSCNKKMKKNEDIKKK